MKLDQQTNFDALKGRYMQVTITFDLDETKRWSVNPNVDDTPHLYEEDQRLLYRQIVHCALACLNP